MNPPLILLISIFFPFEMLLVRFPYGVKRVLISCQVFLQRNLLLLYSYDFHRLICRFEINL